MDKVIDVNLIRKLLPERIENSNKGTFGKVLNIAGSNNYSGAAFLSSISALKVGAGYVTLASEKFVINSIASMSCDITFLELNCGIFDKLQDFDVFSIGCGLSQSVFSVNIVKNFLDCFKNSDEKFVFDADALNIIAKLENPQLPKNSILTPHPKELSRLLDVDVTEILANREHFISQAFEKFGCSIVLKGNKSLVCDTHGNIFVNLTGNSALAKAGCGDVLTGMIAGFAAQGAAIEDATILAVYLHGLSGDLYSEDFSQYSMLASDLLKYIPLAIQKVI